MEIDTTWIVVSAVCFVVGVIVGVIVGEFRQAHKFITKVSKDPDHMIDLLMQLKRELARLKTIEDNHLPQDAIEVIIEHVDHAVLAYNKVTGEFLAQAPSTHEVMQLASKRFPGQRFWHAELEQDDQTA